MWHTGRQSHPSFHESNEVLAPSAIGITSGTTRDSNHESVPYVTPRALTIEDIENTIDDYANCAKLAKAAGLVFLVFHIFQHKFPFDKV
jgi:2,4-dienoyl-CoA reductase-like NADH-dependent reductase (Old Yellow Enzyme family)